MAEGKTPATVQQANPFNFKTHVYIYTIRTYTTKREKNDY